MPTYVYTGCACYPDKSFGTVEKNVPISERDNQTCNECNYSLERVIAFTGLTWAPTAGGMR